MRGKSRNCLSGERKTELVPGKKKAIEINKIEMRLVPDKKNKQKQKK